MNFRILISLLLSIIIFSSPNTGFSEDSKQTNLQERTKLLSRVILDSPNQTLKTFIDSMNLYKKGLDQNDKNLQKNISTAIKTIDLGPTSGVLQFDQFIKGKETALYLKEVLDRIINTKHQVLIENSSTSNNNEVPLEQSWRLDNTDIQIIKKSDGPNKEQFLFSEQTALKAKEFYEKTKHLSYLPGTGKGANFKPLWYIQFIPPWANLTYLIIPNWQWFALLLTILFGLFLKNLTKYLLRSIVKITNFKKIYWQHKTLASIERPLGLLAASAFWFFAIYLFQFEGTLLITLKFIVQLFFGASLIWAAYRLTDVLTEFLTSWSHKTENTLDDHLVPMINKSIHIFVIIFGLLILFQSVGFNVLSILAGLGLGGLAFALAAKDTCANFFGSIMILIDQPFKIGDWIVTNEAEGTVEDIGFRSTRVRTFYKSLITIPNSLIANINIDNMGKREARRVNTTLGVTYDTPPEKVEAFLEGIKDVIRNNPHTDKDYFHVVFSGYGDSSLNIMLYFFLKVPDWKKELAEKENVFLEILRLSQKLGVDFAFPTQTLHVESLPPKDLI